MHRRRRHDEEGATLVICLVIVGVVGVIIASSMTFTAATLNAESGLSNKRRVDLAADGAIDTVIGGMRHNLAAGVYDPYDPAGVAQTCEEAGALTYDDPSIDSNGDGNPVGDDDLTVSCTPDSSSASPSGSAGVLPDNVLLALGGVYGPGNEPGQLDNIPFCDDRHPRNGDCEAGIFVGQGVNDDGGLRVAGTGYTGPAVVSNGSIIAKDGDENRELVVVGGEVKARRECSRVSTVDNDGNDVSGTKRHCDGKAASGNAFTDDPGWLHEWTKPMAGRADTVSRHALTNRPTASVALPLRAVPSVADCADGYVEFQPGWYNSVRQLNTFMADCEGAMMWFQPGVYSFDFVDVGNSTPPYWREPARYSQVVAGTPGPNTWNRCRVAPFTTDISPITNCDQPPKTMTPNKVAPTPNEGNWGVDGNLDGDFADLTGTDTMQQTSDAIELDNDYVSRTLRDRASLELKWDKFFTPLPDKAAVGTDLGSVVFRIRQTAPAASKFKNGTPKIRFQTNNDSCEVSLQAGADKTPTTGVVATDLATGITSIDLSNGCPVAAEGGLAAADGWPKAWTPGLVNDLVAVYSAERATEPSVQYPKVDVDGVDLVVKYKGPPSPSFPNGCDPAADGAQFIFGNLSRMQWKGNDVYFELCGGVVPATGTRVDPHAIGVYGLSNGSNAVPKPQIYYSGLEDTTFTPPSGESPISARTLPADYTNLEAPVAPGNAPTANQYETADDVYGTGAWTDGTAGRYWFYLPNDAVPTGSAIEHVEIRVRHAEPKLESESDKTQVKAVKLRVSKGPGGQDLSDPDGTSKDLAETSIPLNSPLIEDRKLGVFDLQTAKDAFNAMPSQGRWRPTTFPPGVNYYTGTDNSTWTYVYGDDAGEQDIMNALRTSQGVNGARVELDFESYGGTKLAFLDAVEVVVQYRPPGEPRPVRGCMTIRTILDPAPGLGNGDMRGVSPIHFGKPPIEVETDAAYGAGQSKSDSGDCPVVVVWSKNTTNRNSEGTKFHIAGAMYAPTAALEFAGIDNETSFVSDGVVARHISTVRWRQGPDVAAFGGGSVTTKDDRKVVIKAKVGSKLIACATVAFKDRGGIDPAKAGDKVDVQKWLRRVPESQC